MKKGILHFLFLIIFCSGLSAQLSVLGDSLFRKYEQAENDSLKINYLLQLSWEAKNSSIDTAFHFIGIAFDLAQKGNDSLAMAKTSYYKAVFHYYRGEAAGLNAECEKAVTFYRDDVYGKASVYNLKGLMDTETGELQQALESYMASLKLGEKTGNLHAVANPHHNIGMVYEQLGDYDKALESYKDALKLREQIKDSAFIIQSWVAIGGAYFWKRDYDEAEVYLKKSIAALGRKTDNWTLSKALTNLGLVYQETKQYRKALIYFRQATRLQEELQDDFGLVKSYLNISETYMKTKAYAFAIHQASKGVPIARKIESQKELSKLYNILFRSYSKIGNYKKAYEFQNEYISVKDTLLDEVKVKEISALKIQFETEKKEKELLKTKQEKAEADLKISKRDNQLLALAGGTLLMLLAGGFVFYRNKQNQKNKLSEIRIEEQKKGLKAVIYAQEEERKRIAKDLHDGIVQQLGGLKLGFQKFFSNSEDVESRKLMKILDDSAQELREISHQMMPRALSELGLIPALEDMLENSLGNTDIQYEFEHFGIIDRLKENVEIALYRIAQELINNVIKHSDAQNVNIQLFKTAKDIILIVEDDGKGFDSIYSKSGIGLMNISSRLDTVNGKVNFESSPESGTLATVKIMVNG